MTAPSPANRSFGRELATLVRLATPLAVLQLANSAIQGVDTAMAGHLSEVDIAAVSLGNMLYFSTIVVGMGLVLGFDPLIAQALGAGEEAHARHLYRQSVLASFLLSIPLAALVVLVLLALPLFGIDAATADATMRYTTPKLFAIFFFLAGTAARSYLQAIGWTRPLVLGAIVGNVVNVVVGFPLVFGDVALRRVGLPAIGFDGIGVGGAGVAAGASMAAIAAVMFALVPKSTVELGPVLRLDPEVQRKAAVVGLPVGLHYLAEVAAYLIATIAMARLAAAQVAAHQVALTLCSITFQIAVAIGAAASVEVGRAVGEGVPEAPRRAGLLSFALGAIVMLLAALAFALAPALLVEWISDQAHVKALAIDLVRLSALFLLMDGTQTIGAGALRGAGDTATTLRANLFGHYLVGLPLGLYLAFEAGEGVFGMWVGLSVGLTIVALVVFVRFLRLTRGTIERL